MNIKTSKILLWLLLISNMVSCSLPKAFEALAVYNYFDAKAHFESVKKRHPVAANYGLSLIYQKKDNPFHSLDSAYNAIVYASSHFDSLRPKHKEKYAEFEIDKKSILVQQNIIAVDMYQRAIGLNTELAFQKFIDKNETNFLVPSAIFKRDSLSFKSASLKNSANGYLSFLNQYPNSEFRDSAQKKYNRLLYSEQTKNGDLNSFINFTSNYPDSPFLSEAENKIYLIETENRTVESYESFINRHPNNSNVNEAWQKLYDAYLTENLDNSAISDFIKRYPNNPLNKQITGDLVLNDTKLYPVQFQEKWGFISDDSVYIIPNTFDYVDPFSEGLAAVVVNNKVGYITKMGQLKVMCQFDEGLPFSEGCAVVEINDKYGMINRQGEFVIQPEFDFLGQLKNGLVPFEKNEKFGYFDQKGRVKIMEIFDEAYDFERGFARVVINNKWGVINDNGEYVFEPRYSNLKRFSTTTFGLEKDSLWGVLSVLKDTVIPLRYDYVSAPSHSFYMVSKNDSFNYFSTDDHLLLSGSWLPIYPEYKILGKYNQNPILFKDNDGYNFIQMDGSTIFKNAKKMLGNYSELVAYRNDEFWGYLSTNPPKEIVKPKFDAAESFQNGFGIVSLNAKVGLIDREENYMIKPKFSRLEFISENLLIAENDGDFGMLNVKGDTVLVFSDHKIEPFEDNIVKLSNKSNVCYYNFIKNSWISRKE
ncbi:MAG: WG repeat-containing protein [Crocinitomicaceae bacterium]